MDSTDVPAGSPGALTETQRRKLKMLPPAVGPALLATVVGGCVAARHLGYAVLAGVWFATMLGVGALVFVLAQHALRLRWGVIPRRTMEWVALGFAYAFVTLFVVCVCAKALYPWFTDASAWPPWERFTITGFWIRGILYFIVLAAVGVRYASRSAKQDESGNPETTAGLRAAALPFLLIVLVVTVGLGTDWIGGLEGADLGPGTAALFAAYSLAGGLAAALAVTVIATVCYERGGLLPESWQARRGRLAGALLGALLLTAALGAALACFAGSAEPSTLAAWRGHWLAGSWQAVSVLLVAAHGVGLLLVLPGVRRSGGALIAVAACVLLGRYLDAFQLVLPVWSPTDAPATVFLELLGLVVGMTAPWVAFTLSLLAKRVYPVRDPNLD
jgi:hypothetical protein